MPLEMHFEVSFGCKPTSTNIALKRTLTCMRSDMYLEGGVTTEHLPAVSAAVLEEWFISAP